LAIALGYPGLIQPADESFMIAETERKFMELYFLRHGLAVEQGTPGYHDDADRPLTPKGERKLWRIAQAMEALEISFDLILSSPYLRARQTAEIIAAAFNARKKLEFSNDLTPGGSSKSLIQFLSEVKPTPGSILLVGHEPYLSGLISLLISGETGISVVMKKGGLCKLTVKVLRNGRCASLEWLLTPKQMGLMA
jgi:phosphohistidine phosphatase